MNQTCLGSEPAISPKVDQQQPYFPSKNLATLHQEQFQTYK